MSRQSPDPYRRPTPMTTCSCRARVPLRRVEPRAPGAKAVIGFFCPRCDFKRPK